MSHAEFDINCAIIGAGVGGAYCHYRLAAAGHDAMLFEASGRIGGRLWSLPRNGGGAPAELGGLSFSSTHGSVIGLVEKFELSKTPLHFSLGARLLRGRRFDTGDEGEPRDLPYVLGDGERHRSASQLVLQAITKIAPELSWRRFDSVRQSRRALASYLRRLNFEGAPLWRWSFWTLLTRVLSHEAVEFAKYCFGSAATFGDINAYDAIWTVLAECAPDQQHFRLEDGFDALPKAFAVAAGAPVRLYHRLVRATRVGEIFHLAFATPAGMSVIRARQLILALPQRALASLQLDAVLNASVGIGQLLAAATPVDACKLFFTYDHAWWNAVDEERDGARVVASFTDQPLRQTYAFSPAAHDASALMLALYADDVEVRYWSALANGERAEVRPGFEPQAPDLIPTKRLLASARAQLRALEPLADAHEPNGWAFVDWSAPAHGGAWHTFRPGVESWRVRERLRRPDPDLALFICGEAFAELQGWTEGALNNAEMMLERHFGVGRPDWVDPQYPFEIEGEVP